MAMYYSASQRGFYHPELHKTLPSDAVPVAHDEYQALFEGQAAGHEIVPDQAGRPTLQRPAE